MSIEYDVKEHDFAEELKGIKTTQEYFNMSLDELLEIRNEYNYTREECKLFDDGLEIVFFDNEQELINEQKQFNKHIVNRRFEVKAIVKTINERIAVVLN